MNYWPAEVTNLPETVGPLADFVGRLTVPGAVTARKTYGTRGWTLHHLTDPFGRTGVADGVWGVSPMAGPWMTFPLWDHYEFTGDTAFLRERRLPDHEGLGRIRRRLPRPVPRRLAGHRALPFAGERLHRPEDGQSRNR